MIPKNIFQTWETTSLPQGMMKAQQSWILKNPGYSYKLYNATERIEFIKKYFEPNILETYLNIIPPAFQVDIFRICLLYVYGGFYIDADMVCETPLDEVFNQDDLSFIIGRDDPMGYKWLANGFIGSTPNHPFLKKILDRIIYNIQLRKEMFYLDYTGPACVGKSINEALGNNIEKDYELGNNNGLLILKHDPSRKIIYDDKVILYHPYEGYEYDMKELNNKSYYHFYVQNKRIYREIPNTLIYTSYNLFDVNTYMIDSFKKHNPEYEFKYFSQDDVDLWFKNTSYEPTYKKLKERGEKSDFFRYCYLYENGGVYTDTDTFCNQPIRNWLTYQDFVIGLECDNDLPFDFFKEVGLEITGKMKSVGNWTIASSPKHIILKNVIEDIINNPKYGVLFNTGPARLNKHIFNYFGDNTLQGKSELLPINAFGSNQNHSNSFKSSNPFNVTRKDIFITHMFEGTWRNPLYNNIIKLHKESYPSVSHNLTIFKTKNGFKGISRFDENQERTIFMKEIGECKSIKEYIFDNNFKVIDSNILPIKGYVNKAKFEDYRHFTYKGNNYYCCAYIDRYFNTNMAILDNSYNFLGDINIDNYNRMSFGVGPEVYFEKNWLFFEQDEELYFIYSTTPNFIIYKCLDFNKLIFEKHTEQNIDLLHNIPKEEMYFSKVTTGGSTNPILINDKYVYLIHTKIYNERKYNYYVVSFDKNFKINIINSNTIINKNIEYSLFFITTMIDNNDTISLTGGLEDNQNFILNIPKYKLLKYIS